VTLWSRRGTDLTGHFPDLVAALEDRIRSVTSDGTVLDGEVVVWDHAAGRTDFDLLQRRLVTGRRNMPALVAAHPATFVVFDLLAHRGVDLRANSWTDRRVALEDLACTWVPPLEITPVTHDLDEAHQWMQDMRTSGVEGIVVKGAASRYRPGRRDWVKVKPREAAAVVVGAVIGPRGRPTHLVVGAYRDGQLIVTGRSSVLSEPASRRLAELLTPAPADHPWPNRLSSGGFGQSGKVDITKVAPNLVVEVSADPARSSDGRFRHSVRYLRPRLDLDATEIEL
jgi:ATP-dependent DNA ligase